MGENLNVVLGRVFNSKLDSFALLHSTCTACAQPFLELKTQLRFGTGK